MACADDVTVKAKAATAINLTIRILQCSSFNGYPQRNIAGTWRDEGVGLFAQRFAASLAGMHDLFVSIIHVYTRFDLSRGLPRLYEA